jgi:CheY-like chemotaxis protein
VPSKVIDGLRLYAGVKQGSMVSEDHCVVLLLASNNQDGVLITRHITSVDSAIEVCVENTCSAILKYLKNCEQASGAKSCLRPRLIVLCVQELSADVVDILEFLQQSTETAKIPTLVFSESSAPADVKQAYNLKINSYLHKPDNPDEFDEILKEVAAYWLKWNQLPP